MDNIPTQDLHVATGQGRLFVRQWSSPGTAAPIVLFHDSLGCVELWRDFPARLAAATQRRVIAYDRLGFGRSDPHPDRLDRNFVHAEAHHGFGAVREALELERFAAFGHSVGGGMAVACAATFAEDCVALITESAQAFVEGRTLQGILEAQRGFAQLGQVERLAKYHGDKAAWVLSAWIDTWLAPDFANWNLDDALSDVRCPVLALHGDRDEYGSVRHPQRIAELTGGQAMILEDCGHVPHREQRGRVIATVAQWMVDSPDPASSATNQPSNLSKDAQ